MYESMSDASQGTGFAGRAGSADPAGPAEISDKSYPQKVWKSLWKNDEAGP
jgi:hypothetical protein